jgi:predicted ABC-type ATPase
MDKIRTATFIALDKGFTNLCLECLGGFNEAVCPKCAKPLRSTHQDRLALDCGRLIIEMLTRRIDVGFTVGSLPTYSEKEIRQAVAQIILKNGFEKL